VALGLNGTCLLVLFANLLTRNAWWEVAVSIAVVCLALGATAGFQSRRQRMKERRTITDR
jgi:hypothetical protein